MSTAHVLNEQVSCTDGRSEELRAQSALLRSFASLLSTHRHYSGKEGVPTTSHECLEQQQEEIPRLFSAAFNNEQSICCSVPCLQLRRTASDDVAEPSSLESGTSCAGRSVVPPDDTFIRGSAPSRLLSSLEGITADSLRRRIGLTRNQVVDLPLQLLTNCTSTFDALWQARLRQATKALLSRRSTYSTQYGADISARLLKALAKRPPSAVVTMFKTLEFADRCSRVKNQSEEKADDDDFIKTSSSPEAVVVVPVILEVVMDWTFFYSTSANTTTPMEAPGVLQGQFVVDPSNPEMFLLHSVEMELDTGALLQAMMKQAKVLARKAILAAVYRARQTSSNAVVLPQPSWTDLARLIIVTRDNLANHEQSRRQADHVPHSTSVVTEDDVTEDDDLDDEEEALAGASLIAGGKTLLEALFEAETPSGQIATIHSSLQDGDQQSFSLLSPTISGTDIAMAKSPGIDPPAKCAADLDDDTGAAAGDSPSRKRPALSLLIDAVEELQRVSDGSNMIKAMSANVHQS